MPMKKKSIREQISKKPKHVQSKSVESIQFSPNVQKPDQRVFFISAVAIVAIVAIVALILAFSGGMNSKMVAGELIGQAYDTYVPEINAYVDYQVATCQATLNNIERQKMSNSKIKESRIRSLEAIYTKNNCSSIILPLNKTVSLAESVSLKFLGNLSHLTRSQLESLVKTKHGSFMLHFLKGLKGNPDKFNLLYAPLGSNYYETILKNVQEGKRVESTEIYVKVSDWFGVSIPTPKANAQLWIYNKTSQDTPYLLFVKNDSKYQTFKLPGENFYNLIAIVNVSESDKIAWVSINGLKPVMVPFNTEVKLEQFPVAIGVQNHVLGTDMNDFPGITTNFYQVLFFQPKTIT